MARLDIEGAVGVNLATQDLPVLHSQAAGLAALRPLSNIPANHEKTSVGNVAFILLLFLDVISLSDLLYSSILLQLIKRHHCLSVVCILLG